MNYYHPPSVGDFVWCLFPEITGQPGPKSRPAFVVGINTDDPAKPHVKVAYGTSKKLTNLYPSEFAITPADIREYVAAGLSHPTKFDMKNTVVLPYCDTWFAISPNKKFGSTPKMGEALISLVPRIKSAMS